MNKAGIGEIKILKAKGVLVAYGLGSCVGLFLYDASKKVGGLAHIMLAGAAPEGLAFSKTKYAENAIDHILNEMKTAGADLNTITAIVVGGAHMFQEVMDSRSSIGKRNVEGVREVLKRYNIRVKGEDTGGDHGRTMEASVETGKVMVKSFRHGVKTIA